MRHATLRFNADVLRVEPGRLASTFGLTPVAATRVSAEAIRLSTGIFRVRVSVIGEDGIEVEPYFTATSRTGIRRALLERGWQVVEDRWDLKRRSDHD